MRFGLCCLFKNEKIAFRTTTAKVLSVMPRGEQLKKLSGICHSNTPKSGASCARRPLPEYRSLSYNVAAVSPADTSRYGLFAR